MSDRKYGPSRIAEIVIADRHKCFVCDGPVFDNEIECAACGFPQNGDEASQRWFLGDLRVKKRYRKEAEFAVEKAYYYLLMLSIILFLVAFVEWQKYNSILVAQVLLLFGVTFCGIWVWGRNKPRRAFTVSLIVYSLGAIPLIIYIPKIILLSHFMVLMPFFFLSYGLLRFKHWESLDKEVRDKFTG